MPRLFPEDIYESSDESLEMSEPTYSSLKKTSRTRPSRETSIQTDPTTATPTSIEYNAESTYLSRKAIGKKRAREEDDAPFSHHEIKRQRHLDECQWCQLDEFTDARDYPVVITNDVDNIPLPDSFRFIQKSIYRDGVTPADDAFRSGCECADKTDCEKNGCTCVEDVQKVPGTKVAAHRMQYQAPPGDRNCLKDAFLGQRQAIYECNEKCACGPSCKNRVVERGRKVPLEIFKTSDKRGWGLRCQEDLKRGQFIDLYVGEVISAEEAQRRREASSLEKRKDVYLFALDKFTDPESDDPRLTGPPLEVDGEFFSGPTRFMNHSCDPNTRIFARVGDRADMHLHDLAFFAIEDIPAYTELTFDYVDGKDDDLEDEDEGEVIECLCGSKKCRRWLW